MKFQDYQKTTSEKYGQVAFSTLQFTFKFILLISLLNGSFVSGCAAEPIPCMRSDCMSSWILPMISFGGIVGHSWTCPTLPLYRYQTRGKKESNNFLAKYMYGNRRKGILNMHLNIRSVKNKVLEVKNIVKQHNPHIFGLSECELKKENDQFDENLLKVPGYVTLFPKSWTTVGQARILVYVKKTLEFVQVQELEDEEVQSIWIRGGFKNGKKIYFCHGYREHTVLAGISQQSNLEMFLNQWETASTHNNPAEPNELHISGDMNLDCLHGKWLKSDYSLVSLARMVNTHCSVNNLSQLVKVVTRVQYNATRNTTDMSCIDHVYTNVKHRCSEITVTSFGSSDHDLIGYTRYSKEPPAPSRTVRKRSYKNFDSVKYLEELSQVNWTDVLTCPDLDHATEVFTYKLKSLLDVHAPWIQFQQRKFFCPWLTEETKQLMLQRDRLKEKAKELAIRDSNFGPVSEEQREAWKEFKILRNRINNTKKNEEYNFKKSKIEENLSNPAATWSTAKSFMEWRSAGTPSQLEVNNVLETKAHRIARIMNDYFIDKVRKIRDNMAAVPENLTECLRIMLGKGCSLSLQHTSLETVRKLLKNLKGSKSTSVDELDSYSVKLSADYIAEPLHHIITLSIMQKRFPTKWKYTKVIPLHKKESQLQPKNYRPVAILSPLSKVLEKIVYKQMYEYFTSNHIFHPNLHGYRQHRSTQTALLQMYDRWVRAAAAGQVSGVVLLDLSAAFDLVESDLLIKKLRVYGVDEDFCAWVSSYLQDRHQAVWIDHIFSDFVHNSIGVPQGSNLGPLFFLIFYNDLLSALDCPVEVYADDSTVTGTGANVADIGTQLTENCRKVSGWMASNKLKLNADKTHFLVVGTQERLRNTEQPAVNMDGLMLEENAEKCELLLGVEIQSNLKWHSQVTKVVGKLKTRLVGLNKLKFIVPYATRNTITIGVFNSVLVYCLPLYGGCNNAQIKELQVLQNKAGQIVTHKPPYTNRNELYDQLGWLSVAQLIVYHTLLLVFKIRKTGEPEYLADFLKNDSRTGRIIVPNVKLGLAQKSFCFRGSGNWNELPQILRNSLKIGAFKRGVRKWITENVPRFIE